MQISADLYWLTLTILATALMWVPYILNRMSENGMIPAMANPRPDGPPESKWAYRAECAHRNAVENLILFAPLVIAVSISGMETAATGMAGMIYFFTRMAHWAIYVAGVPFLRTVTFSIGVGVQVFLALILLGLA